MNPNDPAYPCTLRTGPNYEQVYFPGISIRLRIASEQMAALITTDMVDNYSTEQIAKSALAAADALIAEEGKT